LGTSGSQVFKGNLLVIPIEKSVFLWSLYTLKSSVGILVRKIVVGYQSGKNLSMVKAQT
jgi:uncharacterized membrane protein (UPF0182 family)